MNLTLKYCILVVVPQQVPKVLDSLSPLDVTNSCQAFIVQMLLNFALCTTSNLVGEKKQKWKKISSLISYLWCSLPRMYVINKEICTRTVCQEDEYRKGQSSTVRKTTTTSLFEPTNVTETSFAHYSRAMPRIVWLAQAGCEILKEEWLSQSPWQHQTLDKHGLMRPPGRIETKFNSCHHKKRTITPSIHQLGVRLVRTSVHTHIYIYAFVFCTWILRGAYFLCVFLDQGHAFQDLWPTLGTAVMDL